MKARPLGINHVALEVGNIDEALEFYGKIFQLKLRGKIPHGAFVDLGDQFIAMMECETPSGGDKRHFGLVVDDSASVRELALAAGAKPVDDDSPDFRDPWGNWIQVVEYREVQFLKANAVITAMGMDGSKDPKAIHELREKGMA